ncbi:MAG: T9SS type A sorting domain-containing protein, partial [Bacteroidota bacterium]
AVNGQTYSSTGSYTSVSGCATEILNLTITSSSSNTTTETACDSYTWAVNGQTYTQSGSYSSVSGCATSILNLTIISSTNNTTSATACGSYTWTVNGQTYTQSGTYSSVSGCGTQTLNLTISTGLSATSSAGSIACFGGSTTVTVSASGGVTPYSGTGSFTRSAGTYTFTVTDAAGCTATTSATVTQPTALSASSSAGTITCFGGSTTVTVSATGGTTPYTGTGSFTRSAGTYTFTVTDNSGCTSTTSVTITQPAQLSVSAVASTPIACNGGSTTVVVSASGGTGPYSGTGSFTRSAGTYSFTVTDANGCTATGSVTLTQPTAISATATAGTIACNGGSTTVTVSATGGTAPYTGTGSFTRSAGSYTFTVTDANGCSATASVTITQPAALVASSSAGTIACFGGSTTVTVSATGGTTPYTGTGSFTRTAGTYTFTVTDNRGCTSTTSVTITQPTAVAVTASVSSAILCNGGSTTVSVSATGGTSPYNGTGSFTRSAGTYSFTVTDANGCTGTSSITITQPTAIALTFSQTNVTTVGGTNGSATVTATGGTPAYTYSWNTVPIQTTATASNLAAGTYVVTVTDANGCTRTGSVTITQPAVGNCGPFRTYGPGGWGSSSTSISGAYLDANFAMVFPNGLVIGSCGRFIRITTSTAIRSFLPTTGTPRQLNNGTLLNPTSASYGNTMAAQLVALRLNLAFDSANAAFAPSATLFANQVITTGQFAGWTVQQLYNAANTAIGCGGTKTYLSALTDALNLVNESWRDGIQRNTYVACPGTTVARSVESTEVFNAAPVAYPNPTTDKVTVAYEMDMAGKAIFEVYNMTGQRVVMREAEHMDGGKYTIEIPLTEQGLAPGMYLLRVVRNGEPSDLRLILAN